MRGQPITLLDEVGEVTELAELHDQMDVSAGLLTVYEGDDMGMMKVFEDVNLRVQIFLELLVELVKMDRFDGDQSSRFLQ